MNVSWPPWMTNLPIAAWLGLGMLAMGIGVFALFWGRRTRMLTRFPGLAPELRQGATYRKLAEAIAAEKSGDYEKAGAIFDAVRLYADARRAYQKAKNAAKIAQTYLKDGKPLEAAQWYERAGDLGRAVELYRSAGKLTEAARSAKLAGELATAAELYSQAGDHVSAAELYKATGQTEKAVTELELAGNAYAAAQLAAEVVAAFFRSIREGKTYSPARVREIEALAQRAARPLCESAEPSDHEQALQLLLLCRDYAGAAQVCRQLNRLEKAVDLYLRVGDRRKAAEVMDELGRPKESARLKGEAFFERNMLREAAAQFEAAEEWERAAEAFERLGENIKAALLYQRLERWVQAGDLFEKEGRDAEAATCFKAAGDTERTLRCYERLGEWGAYTELLEKLERHFEAGLNYLQRGLIDKAIKALQRVEESDPNYAEAALRLGDLFQEKGMYGLAKEKYLSIVGQERVQRKNIDVYYKLGSALENNGELTQALAIFERILGYDFHYKDVNQRLTSLKARMAARTGATPLPGMTPPGITPSGMASIDPYAQTLVQSAAPQRRRYEVIAELGRGGMGVVYKARDTVLDRIVALKVLPPMFRQNEVALRNFFREAKSAAALSHPNIVTIYDSGEEAGSPYIAMEFVEGQDLKQIVTKQGALPLGPLMLIFGQMCQALAYAHGQSIVHRDIKPSNVLWTKAKQVKITDFGLARAITQTTHTLTTTGGTPYYMSPEQTLGNPLDHRTDIYSLGIMMFELATGTLPFSQGDIGYHHVHTPAPDPREANPNLPDKLAQVILRCLGKKPADRFSRADEIFEALREAALS